MGRKPRSKIGQQVQQNVRTPHWLPEPPGYQVYNRGLNKYHQAPGYLYKALSSKYARPNQVLAKSDTDPIEAGQAQHSQKSKAAQPFVSKGNRPAKKKYSTGAK